MTEKNLLTVEDLEKVSGGQNHTGVLTTERARFVSKAFFYASEDLTRAAVITNCYADRVRFETYVMTVDNGNFTLVPDGRGPFNWFHSQFLREYPIECDKCDSMY